MAAVELASPPRSIVVLGASNVSRGLPRLVAAVRDRATGPLEISVVAGHGRSYGANSRVWMRRLPSILWCGVWRALDRISDLRADPPPLHALVTDVGNDLLYGFPADQVATWVREAVARLAARKATIAITRLPLASISGVGSFRYSLLRTLYVPGCRLSLDDLKSAANRLDQQLLAIAAEFGATVIEQPQDWYAFDAIHLRRRSLDRLWSESCDAWGLPRPAASPRASLASWAVLGSRTAEVRMLAGRMRYTRQPTVERDGLRISLY